MAKVVKFEKIADMFFEVSLELRKECIKYIKNVIKKYGEVDFDDCVSSVCVCYDGGNHPEYNSNCFSMVYGAHLNNGNVMLNIEDCDEYDIERVQTEEVYDLADFIKNVYIPSLKEDKD